MKKIVATLLFLSSLITKSQSLSKNEIIGAWSVSKGYSEIENPRIKPLIDAFKKALFVFKKDQNFELSSLHNNSIFSMISEMTKESKWKWLEKTNLLKIGNEDDNYSIMEIQITKEKGKVFFYLEESNLKLEMRKQK